MPDLVVAGAGMAGLVAAARARELGASVTILEKGDRPGGSMLLSSGFVWRYRDLETFRAECPHGDPVLQRLVLERLDESLVWLESLGADILERETSNPLTVGLRFEPGSVVRALGEDVRLGVPLEEVPDNGPVVLATGGFQGNRDLVRRHITAEADSLLLRANPWSTGDGLRLAQGRGAALTAGLDEFYGRNLAAAPHISPNDFVPLSQVYARLATVTNSRGETYEARTWSEIDVVQWTARQPGARAWYRIPAGALGEPVRERTVADLIDAAEAAGAPVERRDAEVIVGVRAGITTTLGGIRIDERAQAAEGLFVAGADAGGLSTGGYSSGLAAALVFGRIAAESALA